MNVETYFLRYAFPCTDVRLMRKEITQEKADELKQAALGKRSVDRRELEEIFYSAFDELEKVAKEMGKDKWDYDVIHDYFHIHHNPMIDRGERLYANLPESMRELCKVYKAKIISVGESAYSVEYDNGKQIQKRIVLKDFVPDAKVDDFIMIHYGYAVEKV